MWLRSLWYILTLRCEEADRLRAVSERAALKTHQRVAERIHRGLCSGCRRAARQLERIDRGLRDLAGDEAGGGVHPEWDAARRARMEAAFREQGGPSDRA